MSDNTKYRWGRVPVEFLHPAAPLWTGTITLGSHLDGEKWKCTALWPSVGAVHKHPALLSLQAHSRMACPHVFEVTQRPVTRFGQCKVTRRNRCHCQVEVPRASIRVIKLLSPNHGDHRGNRNGATIRPSWSADNEKRPLQTHTGCTAWGRHKRSPLRCLLLQHHLAHLGRYAQQAHSQESSLETLLHVWALDKNAHSSMTGNSKRTNRNPNLH